MQPTNQHLVTTDGAIERANHLILEFLKVGPRSAREIHAAAEGAKISARTVQRAAISLGVVKTKAGFNGGWTWRLPDDEGGTAKAPTAQPATGMLKNVKVEAMVTEGQARATGKVSAMVDPGRAEVIATRLRKLEAGRGKKAPIYALDPRVIRWAQFGISDPDLKEAYERATTDHTGILTAGVMDKYVSEVIAEGDKA